LPNYRRNYVSGGTYFFTVVTYERRPILSTEISRRLFREAILKEQSKRPFKILAMVLLPDHIHSIWVLPSQQDDYSLRWKRIKEEFTRQFLASGGQEGTRSNSRVRQGERAVWQRRFWKHTCRDEEDLKRCVDYIHWNPVKHRLVSAVKDYPWSTFHRFVRLGEYPLNWGGENPCPGFDDPEWE
jgi:putative transposase